jgi:hypothetical protein
MSEANRKYARTARAKYKELSRLLKTVPLAMYLVEDRKEQRRLKKIRPTEGIKYISNYEEGILRVMKRRSQPALTARLLAVNFLSYHFDVSKFTDATISNLQTLLTEQFKSGIEAGKRRK